MNSTDKTDQAMQYWYTTIHSSYDFLQHKRVHDLKKEEKVDREYEHL